MPLNSSVVPPKPSAPWSWVIRKILLRCPATAPAGQVISPDREARSEIWDSPSLQLAGKGFASQSADLYKKPSF